MAGPARFGAGCLCCECPNTLTITARCCTTYGGFTNCTPISGATITVKSGATTLATVTTGSDGGASVTFVSAPGTITVEFSKTGYHARSTTVDYSSCTQSKSVVFETCPTSLAVTFRTTLRGVYGTCVGGIGAGSCPISGVAVSVSGGATGSGTTDANGEAVISLSTPSDCSALSLTIATTPPSGHGCQSGSATYSVPTCGAATVPLCLLPAADHTPIICGERYLPRVLTWTDEHGTATITYNDANLKWEGSYTFTTTDGVKKVAC